jgi:glycosyltransferase involved in cell wall biosynthesis
MKLSFVIPAYNEEHYIGDCLDSILRQKNEAKCEVEVVVVNNASTDGTAAVAGSYPHVKLVNEPHKGIVWARRAGFAASTGDLIAQVDADSRLTPGWIDKVATAFGKDEKLVALSGPYLYYDLSLMKRFWVWVFYVPTYVSYLVNRFVLRTGSVVLGGNCVVRRDALEKIGGYDTSIEFYGEDTDIARRMSKVGKVVFTFRLPMYTSGRRLAKEGTFTTGLRYALNYFWIILFKKPFTKEYADFRPKKKEEGSRIKGQGSRIKD